MINEDLDKRQSVLIDAMRFPLIVLVVFSHVLSFNQEPINMDFSAGNIYHFVSEMISHVIGRIPVSCFFLFSGYFFFRNVKKWSFDIYKSRIKKRITGILIPYLLWNIIMIIAIIAKNYAFSALDIGNTSELTFIKESSIYALLWGMPINFPLWFMRDLFCLSLITPLLYPFFKYTKVYGLIAIIAFYIISDWETGVAGFSMRSIVFFGMGSYFGIHKKNMLQVFTKYKHISIILSVVLMFVATYLTATEYYEQARRLFTIFGISAAFNIMNYIVENKTIVSNLLKLSTTVFFIYVAHSIYIMGWVKGALFNSPLGDNAIGMLFAYFLIPVIVVFILIVLHNIWKKLSPGSLAFFMGGRIEKPLKPVKQ